MQFLNNFVRCEFVHTFPRSNVVNRSEDLLVARIANVNWHSKRRCAGATASAFIRGRAKKSQMVEAGGIEPPSEDLPVMATTRLVRAFELAIKPPADRLPESQPI